MALDETAIAERAATELGVSVPDDKLTRLVTAAVERCAEYTNQAADDLSAADEQLTYGVQLAAQTLYTRTGSPSSTLSALGDEVLASMGNPQMFDRTITTLWDHAVVTWGVT